MWFYILRRILYSIPVLILVSFITFVFMSSTQDPLTELRQNPRVSKQTIENIIERNHLHDSVVVRYGYWVKEAVTHKFGNTLLGNQPIWPDLERVMGHTLQLIIAAEIVAVLFAIFIGVYSAIRQYSLFDYGSTFFSFLAFSLPIFWLALMLQVLFVEISRNWGVRIFYTAQLESPNAGSGFHFLLDRVQHLALPVICVAIVSIAQYTRFLRGSMLETINSDYVRTARAKGLPERRVIMRHAFRNALIPFVTVVALDFAGLFSGAVVTETIFTLDGMGYYFIQQLSKADPYPLTAWLVITSVIIIGFNLLTDILYGVLDPRIRYD
jgi:peptide/nickel transport system permease protein